MCWSLTCTSLWFPVIFQIVWCTSVCSCFVPACSWPQPVPGSCLLLPCLLSLRSLTDYLLLNSPRLPIKSSFNSSASESCLWVHISVFRSLTVRAVSPCSHLTQTMTTLAFSLSSPFKKYSVHFFCSILHYSLYIMSHFFAVILLFSLSLISLLMIACLPFQMGQHCVKSG